MCLALGVSTRATRRGEAVVAAHLAARYAAAPYRRSFTRAELGNLVLAEFSDIALARTRPPAPCTVCCTFRTRAGHLYQQATSLHLLVRGAGLQPVGLHACVSR